MKIIKDDLEIKVETPLTKLRDNFSKHTIDFTCIEKLIGNKEILNQSFREVFHQSLADIKHK